MKFLGSFVTAVSGSLGGITASRGRGGQFLRARLIPTDPISGDQAVRRSVFADVSAQWLTLLTTAQREAWDLYAENTPMTDSLGQSFLLSGHQHFVRSGTYSVMLGNSVFDDAPTTFGIGASPVISSFSATDAELSVGVSNIPAGGVTGVIAGRPQNVSHNYFRGPFRFGQSSGSSPITVTQPYPAAAGQRQWAEVRNQDAEGRLSQATQAGPVVVTAAP